MNVDHCLTPMALSNRVLTAPILLAMLMLSTSCGSLTGPARCRTETRGADAIGEVVLPDGSTVRSGIVLGEERLAGRPETTVRRLQVYAQSYFLYGHMTRAELRDAQPLSTLFETYAPGEGDEKWAPNLFGVFRPYSWSLPVDQARTLVSSGGLVLIIYTDLPDQSS